MIPINNTAVLYDNWGALFDDQTFRISRNRIALATTPSTGSQVLDSWITPATIN